MTNLPTPSRTIIGTRTSTMAMTQAAHVASLLKDAHPALATHFAEITTTADRHTGPLDTVGGKAAWVRELDQALIQGRADITVSCAKDLPGPHERSSLVEIGAVLTRQDPRDALVLPAGTQPTTLAELPAGTIVGTIAPRRTAQLRARHPHLTVTPMRGNLDSRIARLDAPGTAPRLDALVVSHAGLQRIGFADRAAEVLPVDDFLPATGAGFVIVEHRAGDALAAQLLAAVNDPAAARLLRIERGVLGALGGDCHTACSVHAAYDEPGTHVRVEAFVFSPDGEHSVGTTVVQPVGDDQVVVDRVAQQLHDRGAEELLSAG
ncbi:hydroxymethylbilane synthase [Streptomyces sp. NPDC050161]|uniref:hydroxymethylbilane synthase n=1 Tax=Streptomyces sp. NPDC050161 TaxID=3365604 RepID=UPI0037AEEA10